jgi:hypothetical protein
MNFTILFIFHIKWMIIIIITYSSMSTYSYILHMLNHFRNNYV